MSLATSQVNRLPDHEKGAEVLRQRLKAPMDETLQADSSLFSALFAPAFAAPLEPHAFPIGEANSAKAPHVVSLPAHLNDDMVLNALEVQISDGIEGHSSDMSCTLLLPHLGEVRMNASQSASQWHIHLAFMRPEALEYARRTQTTTTQRLREKLGSNIVLGFSLREEREADE